MQLINRNDWPERSLVYLCRSFNNLTTGQDYIDVMPTIHIGILDFTLFPKYPEFYARYAMKNIKNENIYSDKLLLNVLDLTQIHLATDEDIQSGLAHWAKLFKTETWEDMQMLASEYRDFEDIPDTMQKALEDKKNDCSAKRGNDTSVTVPPCTIAESGTGLTLGSLKVPILSETKVLKN